MKKHKIEIRARRFGQKAKLKQQYIDYLKQNQMKYQGKLYGKINNEYVELKYNSTEVDILENKVMMLVADVNFLEKQLKELKYILDSRDEQVVQILNILNKRLV
jgi:hypothetical protein